MPRRELVRALVYRQTPRDAAVAQIGAYSAAADLGAKSRYRSKGAQLGGEEQLTRYLADIQRLLSHPVARQVQDLVPFIPYGKGEHADAACESRIDAPLCDGCEQHLGALSRGKLQRNVRNC